MVFYIPDNQNHWYKATPTRIGPPDLKLIAQLGATYYSIRCCYHVAE
jgi:hypothetical protein